MKVTLAHTSNIVEIGKLAEEIWWKHYPEIIGEEQVNYMLNLMYSEQALEQQMEKGQKFLLIEYNGQPIGFLSFSEIEEQEYFIHKWYIKPEYQGKGIGNETFEQWLEQISDCKKVKLTVNRKNYKSINFYFKLGFFIERVANFDIGNGFEMEDFVMQWSNNIKK